MTEYTCCLAFTPGAPGFRMGKLALIRKTHPRWQAGRFNGIGGKMEPCDAGRIGPGASREFLEETGVSIPPEAWRHFLTLTDAATWTVYFVTVTSEAVREARTMSDEEVLRHEPEWWLQFGNLVPNLRWIIPLAMHSDEFVVPVIGIERAWHSATEPTVPAEVAHAGA